LTAIAELVERALDFRGFVTLSRRDGSQIVGYVYDRGPAHVELFGEDARQRIRIPLSDIADIVLTGEDSAAKAHEIWERRRGRLEPHGTSAWAGWEHRPVLLLSALPFELALPQRIADLVPVIRAIGVGGSAAAIIDAERPGIVISCGFAGAVAPGLATGAVVIATAVTDGAGHKLLADDRLRARARDALFGLATEGELICTTRVAATPAEKAALAAPTRLAVDLESWPIARGAERAGVRWLAIRVILDPADLALPDFTREPRASYAGPALRHAARGPRAIRGLIDLGLRARTARRTLSLALRNLLGAFAEQPP
jgi:hypothetical protein